MQEIILIKDIMAIALVIVVITFSIISILRIKKNQPPDFIKQYLQYLTGILFAFSMPIISFIFTPAGGDTTVFTMMTFTILTYELNCIFSKAFKDKYFKKNEQLTVLLVFVLLILAFVFHKIYTGVYKIAVVTILIIESWLAIGLSYLFMSNNFNKTNKYYSIFFLNILLSSLIGIIYGWWIRAFWVDFIIIGRLVSILGFLIPLSIITYLYILDYYKSDKVESISNRNKQYYIFDIDNYTVGKLKDYSVKNNEDVNDIINRIINI